MTKQPSTRVESNSWQWLPNGWSWTNYANSWTPSADDVDAQKKLLEKRASYQGTGKVQVTPRTDPVPVGVPGSWPPITPDYVPRHGILVDHVYVQSPFASDTPRPQIRGGFPQLSRSGSRQREWNTGNPGVIRTFPLNGSPASKYTTDQHNTRPHPSGDIIYR